METERGLHILHSECAMSGELADAIEALSELRQITAKRILFRQGQPPDRLFLLKAGQVIMTRRLDDNSVIGFRAVPGSLIGLSAIAGSLPYSMTATVTKRSLLHTISLPTFREIVGSNPSVSFRVRKSLASSVCLVPILAFKAGSSVGES